MTGFVIYRGTSPIRKRPPPQDPPKTLGIGLRKGPKGVHWFVGEVPVYVGKTHGRLPHPPPDRNGAFI